MRSLANLGAFELGFEAGDEGVGAEHQVGVLAGAALESLVADLADEIDGELVARLRLGAFLARREGAMAVEELVEAVLHFLFRHFGNQALQLDVVEGAEFEGRKDFEGQAELQVARGFEDLFHLGLVFGEVELGLAGEANLVVLEDLLLRFADGLLDDVAHDRLAIEAAQMRGRHLAGAEPVDAHLGLDVGELRVELGREFGGGQHHLIGALQPLRKRFGRLHRQNLLKPDRRAAQASKLLKLLRRAAKPAPLVRAEGLEPPRFSPPEPKSGASTSSATPARG